MSELRTCRSHFSVLTSRFVFRFGSGFNVHGSMFARVEDRTWNFEPNLNTNRDRRTQKRERLLLTARVDDYRDDRHQHGRGWCRQRRTDGCRGDDVIVLKPFLETTTYRNLLATGAAVVNLTDDVRLFATAAISNPQYPTVPATVVRGVVLAGLLLLAGSQPWSVDSTPRSRVETEVVHRGVRREFIGFNRARHAVARGRDLRDTPSPVAAYLHRKRAGAASSHRGQDRWARRARGHGAPGGVRPLRASFDPHRMTQRPRLSDTRPRLGHPTSKFVEESGGEAVFVEAAARLHFGVLDLRGARGRWFGGIGTAAPAPTLLVSAMAADALHVAGEDAERAADFAARFLAHYRIAVARGCMCTGRRRDMRGSARHSARAGGGTSARNASWNRRRPTGARAPWGGRAIGRRHLDLCGRRSGGRGRTARRSRRVRPALPVCRSRPHGAVLLWCPTGRPGSAESPKLPHSIGSRHRPSTRLNVWRTSCSCRCCRRSPMPISKRSGPRSLRSRR